MRKHINVFVIISALSVPFCLPVYPVSAGQKMIMAALEPKDSPTGKLVNLIYTEAFRRLGLELEYRYYPGKRASLMADEGKVDGELIRVGTYGDAHPDLVRVEEPAILTAFSAFSIDPAIQLAGWESLRDTRYKVEYLRGDRRAHDKLTKLVPPDNLSAINSVTQGVKKIIAGRTDIYIGPESVVRQSLQAEEIRQFLKTQGVRDSDIRTAGVMEEIGLHAYMHKKYKDIASKLSTILKVMKEEGLIEKYQAMTEG